MMNKRSIIRQNKIEIRWADSENRTKLNERVITLDQEISSSVYQVQKGENKIR